VEDRIDALREHRIGRAAHKLGVSQRALRRWATNNGYAHLIRDRPTPDEVRAAFARCTSLAAAAALLDVGVDQARTLRDEYGLELARRPRLVPTDDQIEAAYRSHRTLQDAAFALGISCATMGDRARALGLTRLGAPPSDAQLEATWRARPGVRRVARRLGCTEGQVTAWLARRAGL